MTVPDPNDLAGLQRGAGFRLAMFTKSPQALPSDLTGATVPVKMELEQEAERETGRKH